MQNLISHDQTTPLLTELFSKGHGNCDVSCGLHAYFVFVNWIFINLLAFFRSIFDDEI